MAIREGLCPNCGSLLRVDDATEQTSCIFCWADVNNQEAMRLLENSEGHTFANEQFSPKSAEEQAKALQTQGIGHGQVAKVQTPKKQIQRKEGKLTPREKVALQNKPIVKPYCSKKHRLGIIIGALAFVLALAAISLPLYFSRENKKNAIMEGLPSIASYAGEENRVMFNNQSNNLVTLVSPEGVDAEEAETIFQEFAAIYASVYEITEEEAMDRIEIRVVSEEQGGYRVREINNEIVTDDLA